MISNKYSWKTKHEKRIRTLGLREKKKILGVRARNCGMEIFFQNKFISE